MQDILVATVAVTALAVLCGSAPPARADGALTDQGQLRQAGTPFTGLADMQFRLYDARIGCTEIAAIARDGVPVEDGLFKVELDFGAAAFDGGDRFLEIRVDGATLDPRQKVTATPYALVATGMASGSVGGGSIDPTEVQLRVFGACPPGQSIRAVAQDGSVTCEPDDVGAPAWRLGGNAGTDPANDFIGTTDATALELRTAGVRSLRIEPSAELFGRAPITTNTIAAPSANEVLPSVRGATINGGGVPEGDSDPQYSFEEPNRVTDQYDTAGGGYGNVAGGGSGTVVDSPFATVGGGGINTASGSLSTVGGGSENTASGRASTVGGGQRDVASGTDSTVAGGDDNAASGARSFVAGSNLNLASGNFSMAAGRRARAVHLGSFVWSDPSPGDFPSDRTGQFKVRAGGGAEFHADGFGLTAISNAAGVGGAALQGRTEHPNGIAIYASSTSTDRALVLNNAGTGDIIHAFNVGALRLRLENDGDLVIGGDYLQTSDRASKEAIRPVATDDVLRRLQQLPVYSWRYIDDQDAARHTGAMAQDFRAAFGYGDSSRHIAVVDAQGVALAAIKARAERNTELQQRQAALRAENAELAGRLAALEAAVFGERRVAGAE